MKKLILALVVLLTSSCSVNIEYVNRGLIDSMWTTPVPKWDASIQRYDTTIAYIIKTDKGKFVVSEYQFKDFTVADTLFLPVVKKR